MQIDANQGQGNAPPSHEHVRTEDGGNVSHTQGMDIDISPPNHLPNQEHSTSTLPPSEISSSSTFQLRKIAPLTYVPPRGGVPPPTPSVQSPDKCECTTAIDYERYIKNGAIPRTKKTYATIYTCTLCNTNFKTRKSLERHMKNIHAAYSQKEKGKKRKNENEHELKKRIKRNYSYYLES